MANDPDDKPSEAEDKPKTSDAPPAAKTSEPPPAKKSDPPPAAKTSEPPPAKKSEPPPAAKTSEPPPAKKSDPPPADDAAAAKSEAAAEEKATAKAEAAKEAEEEDAKEEAAAAKEPAKPKGSKSRDAVKTVGDQPKAKKKIAEAKAAAEGGKAAKAARAAQPEAHVDGQHAQHGHTVNRREYIVMFFVLAILTVLEVGITKVPGIDKLMMRVGLVALALTKAACVGLYYMHLKHETRVLRATVMLPFAAPAVYAVVLISEAAWRLVRW